MGIRINRRNDRANAHKLQKSNLQTCLTAPDSPIIIIDDWAAWTKWFIALSFFRAQRCQQLATSHVSSG